MKSEYLNFSKNKKKNHDIIGVHSPPPPPAPPKILGPPLIYLVGPLAISDPHINICVRPPNTSVA